MDVTKALDSTSLLHQYCYDRYGCTLNVRILNRLVIEYSTFNPVDPEVWLKIALIDLNCFSAGCTLPPPIRLSMKLHIDWGHGPIVVPLRVRQEWDHPTKDRKRAGRNPGLGDDLFNGHLYSIPQHRDER